MNQSKPTISAVILTRNEEQRLESCIESLGWADEVVVIDNGSSDKTVEIAKSLKANVTLSDERDFAKLRDIGKEKSKGDWILYIDADEKILEPLHKEILEATKSGAAVCYYIRRKNYYLGHMWPRQDKIQRLFLRSALVGWHGAVHETATVNGQTKTLINPLEHHTHRTLEEMLEKTNQWSEIEAKLRLNAGHPPVTWWRLLRVSLTGFYESYVSGQGWKAGTVGLVEGIYQGYSMFITYAKLWELQKK